MKTFVCADTHFKHNNIVKFTRDDGSKLRPWDTIEEHDEALVENWNKVVGVKDKVYVLGDFCLSRKALPIAARLNGNKILIKGNHDILRLDEYSQYFQDVRACVVLQWAILTHIPVHPLQLNRFKHNIHGHTHDHFVYHDIFPFERPDERYTCVSMEHINFTPLDLQVLDDKLRKT